MNFIFIPINMEYVKEINSWDYEGFIEKVVMTPYFESFNKTKTLKGPGGCEGFAALLDNKVVGLFEFNKKGNIVEIGLALKPSLVGKGLGVKYVTQGLEFCIRYYNSNLEIIKLVVDSQNKAAIRVYEKVGFKKVDKKENDIEMSLNL